MKAIIFILALVAACPGLSFAQGMGGGGGFGSSMYARQSDGKTMAERNERDKRNLTRDEMPPTSTSMFIDASVLMNVKADEYVAVFGLMQEGSSIADCGEKLDATIAHFEEELKKLGIKREDYFVDFVIQNKIFDYEVAGDVAREKVAGFELKKNISIHYKDKPMLDKLVAAAARWQIFDLVKEDYIVTNTGPVQDKLMEEAARIIKQKAARYGRLLDIKLRQPAQVYAERLNAYYPTEMYDSYTAQESENVMAGSLRQKYVIQEARKSRTFFFNPLGGGGFDSVVNPVVIEPVVQFTLYLKVKYALEPAAPAARP